MKHIFVIDSYPFLDQQVKLESLLKDIEECFSTQEDSDHVVVYSKNRRDALVLIQEQIDNAKDADIVRVYAVGGDEILFDCLNGVSGLPNTELTVIPCDKICDFLRNFGTGKADLFRDLKLFSQASVIPTDIISAGKFFGINACIIGFDSAIPFKTKEWKRKVGSDISKTFPFNKLVPILGNLYTVFDKRIFAQYYNIIIDDIDYSGNYFEIKIANGSYYGGDVVSVPGASPNDGLLDIVLFKSSSLYKNIVSLRNYSQGKILSNCILLQAKKISIQSEEKIWIQMDGLFYQDYKLSIEVVPEAIPIVAVNNLKYKKNTDYYDDDSEYYDEGI